MASSTHAQPEINLAYAPSLLLLPSCEKEGGKEAWLLLLLLLADSLSLSCKARENKVRQRCDCINARVCARVGRGGGEENS